MAELQEHEKALRALWRKVAENGVEFGVDWPRIVLTLFRDIDALTEEHDEWRAICTRQNTALATAEIVAGIPDDAIATPPETDHSAVVHLDAETLAPIGVSTPCPSTTIATLGFNGLNGVRVPCGNLAGHAGPHVFRVEWIDPAPAPSLGERMKAADKPLRRPR